MSECDCFVVVFTVSKQTGALLFEMADYHTHTLLVVDAVDELKTAITINTSSDRPSRN